MWDVKTWDMIRNWNSFAPWLSGIGNLVVIIITLWLVRRDKFIGLLWIQSTSRRPAWKSLQGVLLKDVLPERELDKNSQEMLEKAGLLFIRPDGTMPGRIFCGHQDDDEGDTIESIRELPAMGNLACIRRGIYCAR